MINEKRKCVYVLCSKGVSAQLIVSRMNVNPLVEVTAGSIVKDIQDADIVLLAPQIRYLLQKFKETYPQKQFIVIDIDAYSSLDVDVISKLL